MDIIYYLNWIVFVLMILSLTSMGFMTVITKQPVPLGSVLLGFAILVTTGDHLGMRLPF